jgi:hypothetical protein
MIEVELQIPGGVETESVIRVVEQICASKELTCSLKGTLISYPGSVHWHFKRGRQKGTLEMTWWESGHRLWFKVANGRTSEWILESLPQLKEQIEKMFLSSSLKINRRDIIIKRGDENEH